MDDFGSAESYTPSEAPVGNAEQLNEAARQKFAGIGSALQHIQREEKKSKKRDDGVAQTIMQFLTDEQRAHLSILIARLVERNCPSSFILALLSLINHDCLSASSEHLKESVLPSSRDIVEEHLAHIDMQGMRGESGKNLAEWITRLQLTLSIESNRILPALLTDETHMDGTVLQLASFILQEFFRSQDKEVPLPKLHPFTARMLQSVFEPFLPKGHLAKE